MDRKLYNTCMRPHMSGTGLTKEERQMKMCIGAKICTSKAKNEEEARQICMQPKPPKEPKAKHKGKPQSCEKEVQQIARCMVPKIDMDLASNINSIEVAIINAMMECKCGIEA